MARGAEKTEGRKEARNQGWEREARQEIHLLPPQAASSQTDTEPGCQGAGFAGLCDPR